MKPLTVISVSNHSKRVTDDEVRHMTLAVSHQLFQHVAQVWGPVPAIEFVPHGTKGSINGCPAIVSDTPDIEGAAGYHDEDGIKVFCNPTLDNGGTALSGASSVSVTLSHEILEILGDPAANRWVDGIDNNDYALELCDACEGDSYDIGNVAVSNFLFPAFFDPQAAPSSRFDYLRQIKAPFTLRPESYMIVRTEPGRVSQVFARHLPHGADVIEVGRGVMVIFSRDFPKHKRDAKIAKAKRRRMR